MTGRKVLGEPVAKQFFPKGYTPRWHAGVIRTGRTRVGTWCRHVHATEATAMRCAKRLAGVL